MASRAEPTRAQRQVLRRAVAACTAAAAQLEAAGACASSRSAAGARFGADQPPLKELRRLEELEKSNVATPAWLQLVVDSQAVACFARLMSAVVRAAGCTLTSTPQDLVSLLALGWHLFSFSQDCTRAARTSAARALEAQLASPPVLAAVAAAARFVKDGVPGWSPRAPCVKDGTDHRAPCAYLLRWCTGTALGWVSMYKPTRMIALALGMAEGPETPQQEAEVEARRRRALREEQPVPAAAAGVAAVADLQRDLAAVRDSGVLVDLCAAVLAAPPCEPLAQNPHVEVYSTQLASSQFCLLRALHYVGTSCVWHCGPCAVDILAAPPVLQLRMEALAQVAAAGGGASSSSGSSQQLWQLLQAGSMQTVINEWDIADPTSIYARLVLACVTPVAGGTKLNIAFPHAIRAPAAAWDPAAALQRVFPPRPQAAALLSRACAALCRRLLEAVAGQGATPDAERVATDSAVQTLVATQQASSTLSTLLRGAPPGEVAACMPHVLAAHAWHVRATVSCAGLAAEQPSTLETVLWRLACSLSGDATPLCLLEAKQAVAVWGQLSTEVRAACARALLPTRLMASLDAALRRLGNDAGATDGMIVASTVCARVCPTLIPALLRARLLPATASGAAAAGESACAGGDRQPWRPQDELGVLVTFAKLARREADRIKAAPPAKWQQRGRA